MCAAWMNRRDRGFLAISYRLLVQLFASFFIHSFLCLPPFKLNCRYLRQRYDELRFPRAIVAPQHRMFSTFRMLINTALFIRPNSSVECFHFSTRAMSRDRTSGRSKHYPTPEIVYYTHLGRNKLGQSSGRTKAKVAILIILCGLAN